MKCVTVWLSVSLIPEWRLNLLAVLANSINGASAFLCIRVLTLFRLRCGFELLWICPIAFQVWRWWRRMRSSQTTSRQTSVWGRETTRGRASGGTTIAVCLKSKRLQLYSIKSQWGPEPTMAYKRLTHLFFYNKPKNILSKQTDKCSLIIWW